MQILCSRACMDLETDRASKFRLGGPRLQLLAMPPFEGAGQHRVANVDPQLVGRVVDARIGSTQQTRRTPSDYWEESRLVWDVGVEDQFQLSPDAIRMLASQQVLDKHTTIALKYLDHGFAGGGRTCAVNLLKLRHN